MTKEKGHSTNNSIPTLDIEGIAFHENGTGRGRHRGEGLMKSCGAGFSVGFSVTQQGDSHAA